MHPICTQDEKMNSDYRKIASKSPLGLVFNNNIAVKFHKKKLFQYFRPARTLSWETSLRIISAEAA